MTSPTTKKIRPYHHTNPCPAEFTDLISPTTNLDTDLISYWPKAYDTSLFDSTPTLKTSPPTLLHKLIRSGISKPLNAHNMHNKYMNAYEVESNNSYVKIGHTTRSVTKQHNE